MLTHASIFDSPAKNTFYIIYHHVSIVISLIVNATLITLILKYSRKEMGAYRYLLLTFASFDIYYGIVHFLVMPIPEGWGNAFLMGAHGYVTGKLAVSWFAAVHSHSFIVLVFHFLYRLLAVRGSYYIQYFKKFWCFQAQMMCVAAVGAVWFCVIHYLYDADKFVTDYVEPILKNHTIASSLPLEDYTTAVFWSNGTFSGPRWKPICGFFIMSVTMCSAYGFMIFAAHKIRRLMMTASASLSKKTVSLQKQLMLALMYQTILPLVTAYSPPLIAVSAPFFGISLSVTNLTSILCGAHPWLDGCVIIWAITEYRMHLLHFLRIRKKSDTVEIISSKNSINSKY
ncbi:srj-8 [Pristionchus pacificus]|uniref:Srj-8 n=1 Tax=Pristionchus pacificus TaxID=54126 RepID=A0A2A6CVT7_PRIPA|nr:srj-8 [Pristionchus pacificus]|eukprot:PDM82210.1 srj-8 [Pristionchus pacificus]